MFAILFKVILFINSVSAEPLYEESNLEDIYNIQVTVASKQAVSLKDAPGLITVYNHEDIKRMNYFTLKELAAITPGFSTANIHAGQSNFIVRGQKVEGFDNNKVLVLLDGLPVNHVRNGRAPLDHDLSLVGVKRVEFLRGSASAIYGTGAFFGVINIITSNAEVHTSTTRGDIYYGSYSQKGARAYSIFNNQSISGKIRSAINHHNPTGKVRGYKTNTKDYEQVKTRTNHGFDKVDEYHLDSSITIKEGPLKDLTFGYFTTSNIHGTFEDSSNFNGFGYKFRTSSLYIKYRKSHSENTSTNAYIRKTESIEEGLRYNYNLVFKSIDTLIESSLSITDSSHLLVGINFDTRELKDNNFGTVQNDGTGSNSFVEKGSSPLKTYSAFIQYSKRFNFFKETHLVSGFRLDKAESDFADASKISPRLSIVQTITPNLNLKLLYSSALRSPDLKSTLINAGVIEEGGTLKQSKLNAETASSYELGINYNHQSLLSSLSFFHMIVKDAINRRSFSGKDSYQNDKGETTSHGLEFSVRYSFSKNNSLFSNITYAKARLANITDNSELNGQDVEAVPNITLNTGGSFQYKKIGLTLIGKYIDSFSVSDFSQRHDGFILFDTNLAYSYNPKLDFSLKVSNLFGEDARVPNFQEQYFPRKILGNISFKF